MNTIINNNASVSLSSTNAIINNSGSINLNSSNIALASLSCASLAVGGVNLQNYTDAMVSLETSRAIGVENSITSVINNITGVTLSNEISRAVLADLSLSSSIVSALSVDAVLSSSIVTALANDAFLTSSLSLETSRAINVECSLESLVLTSSISSYLSVATPILNSPNQGAYTVSESSYLSPDYQGYRAFNGIKDKSDSTNFGWNTATNSYIYGECVISYPTNYLSLNNVNSTANGEWVQIYNSNTFPLISGVKLYQNNTIYAISTRIIKNILIVGSNNGTTFEEIYSSAVTFTSAEYNSATVLFTSTKTYSYLRLIVTQIVSTGTIDSLTLGEIEYLTSVPNLLPTKVNTITLLSTSLSSEIITARSVEINLSSSIVSNIATISNSLSSETSRAKSVETALSSSLSSEIIRAKSVETALSSSLSSEISKARSMETVLSISLSSEIIRAKSVETDLSTAVAPYITGLNPYINSKNFKTITAGSFYFNTFSDMPLNTKNIYVKLVGGGAGGGGINGNNVGAGGGAGAYFEGIINIDTLSLYSLYVSAGAGGAIGVAGSFTTITYNYSSIVTAGGGIAGGTSSGAGLGVGGAGGTISINSAYATTVVSSAGTKGYNSTCVYIASTQYGGPGAGGNGYFGTIGAGGAGSTAGNPGIAIIMW